MKTTEQRSLTNAWRREITTTKTGTTIDLHLRRDVKVSTGHQPSRPHYLDIALRPFRPKEPIRNDGDTAVELRIVYYFPHPSGTPKWKRDQVTFMTQRPDADNLSKAVVDCMTKAGFWDDDSMVNFNFAKYRSPNPCIRVEIREWKQTRNKTEEQLFSNS